MPHKQPNLQRQLTNAQLQLDARAATLNERGIKGKDQRKDSAWRQLKATCLQLKSRLGAAEAVVSLSEEVKQRKADKPAKGEADSGGKKEGGKKKGSKKQKAEKNS